LYRQINFFDQVAGTKFHAGMLEIRFRAGTKTLWLPVYYFSFCTGKSIFLISLPVQIFTPVCLKSGSVPVPKHLGCRYIIFHFVPAHQFF
jgi:peroxiredoxin